MIDQEHLRGAQVGVALTADERAALEARVARQASRYAYFKATGDERF